MSLSTIIYLASLSENIGQIFTVFGAISLIGCAILSVIFIVVFCQDSEDGYLIPIKKILKNLVPITILVLLFSAFLPDRVTVYMIIGAKYSQELYQSDTGQKVLQLINKKLDEELKSEKK